jgi:hypothetical protein
MIDEFALAGLCIGCFVCGFCLGALLTYFREARLEENE